jgi:hypothetical protein
MRPLGGPNGSPIGPLDGHKKEDRIECGALWGSGKRPYLNLRGTWKGPHSGSVRTQIWYVTPHILAQG